MMEYLRQSILWNKIIFENEIQFQKGSGPNSFSATHRWCSCWWISLCCISCYRVQKLLVKTSSQPTHNTLDQLKQICSLNSKRTSYQMDFDFFIPWIRKKIFDLLINDIQPVLSQFDLVLLMSKSMDYGHTMAKLRSKFTFKSKSHVYIFGIWM